MGSRRPQEGQGRLLSSICSPSCPAEACSLRVLHAETFSVLDGVRSLSMYVTVHGLLVGYLFDTFILSVSLCATLGTGTAFP